MTRYYAWCVRYVLLMYWNPLVFWVADRLTVEEPSAVYPKPRLGFYPWSKVKAFHRAWYKP